MALSGSSSTISTTLGTLKLAICPRLHVMRSDLPSEQSER